MAVALQVAEVPDIATEVEVKAKRPKNAPKDSTKRRSLRKSEKKALVSVISKADTTDLVAAVLHQVDSEQHLHFFPQRLEVWEKLKISNLFQILCECFKKLYISIYTDYCTGSDKYIKFQLKWYEQCSSMLQECMTNCHSCLYEAAAKWSEFKNDTACST